MDTIKEFLTAAREAEQDGVADEGTVFMIDDHECRCYKPTDGQLAVLMASISRSTNWTDKVAGIINFFVEVLDADSHTYVVGRLLSREDPFGIYDVEAIIEWMVEDWTGRPIQSPSGSTSSRGNGGRRSTPRTRKSTSSGSPRTVSVDSSTHGV